ncbi:hypothetical protein BY996DRAFT_6468689 [Phakopsora pachyrhizi]|nr:hypothetical protein BY996DRAFT_6468689 [Phakopsora pachyrhizi]
MVDQHIDDNLPNLVESPFHNAAYSQDSPFEERDDGKENIQHHSDTKHQDLSMTKKEIQFAKDGKDKELEVRMLIAEKDCEAIKSKENSALLLAVVGSSRTIEEITMISKIYFNR